MSEQLTTSKGERVYLILSKDIPKEMLGPITGIHDVHLGGLIAGKIIDYDELGVWMENSDVDLVDAKSNETNKYTCLVLIKWQFIISIIRIPEREAPKIKNEFGFKI